MRIKWGQDMATAVLFIGIGLAGWLIASGNYPGGAPYAMGTPQRPGTGVLPVILSWCLVGCGAILMVKAIMAGDVAMSAWAWRPFFAVTAATIAFGMFVDDLGLVLTMIISLTLCAVGTVETRWREYWIFLAIMIFVGWGTFIWLLGMPIPTWPLRVPTEFNFLLR